jgi:hypothetical protein
MPPTATLSWRQARARKAGLHNRPNPDPVLVAQASRDYAAAWLAEQITRALADPGLDAAHRAQLAHLVLGGEVAQ